MTYSLPLSSSRLVFELLSLVPVPLAHLAQCHPDLRSDLHLLLERPVGVLLEVAPQDAHLVWSLAHPVACTLAAFQEEVLLL